MDERARALATLSQFLVAGSSLGDALHQVTVITQDAVPAAEMAGITMLSESGRPATTVFTDEEAPEIDQAQYDSGRGPCLDAWRTQQVVRVDRIDDVREAYPEFADACKAHGVVSTLSLPLGAGGQGLGALNLYARTSPGFSSDDEAIGTDLAAAASIVLANASAYWSAFTLSEQLSEAMASRAVIEQAKGMLMAGAPSVTADEAFELLVRASQRENVKLRDVAQRIVDRRAPG